MNKQEYIEELISTIGKLAWQSEDPTLTTSGTPEERLSAILCLYREICGARDGRVEEKYFTPVEDLRRFGRNASLNFYTLADTRPQA